MLRKTCSIKNYFFQLNKFFVRETVYRSPLLAPSPRRRSGICVGGATPSVRTGLRRPETRSGTPGREGSPARPTGASGRCPARRPNRRPTRSPERPSGTPGGRRQPQSRGRGAAAGSCGAAAARRVRPPGGVRGGAGGRTRRRSLRRRPRRRRPGNSSWGATRDIGPLREVKTFVGAQCIWWGFIHVHEKRHCADPLVRLVSSFDRARSEIACITIFLIPSASSGSRSCSTSSSRGGPSTARAPWRRRGGAQPSCWRRREL